MNIKKTEHFQYTLIEVEGIGSMTLNHMFEQAWYDLLDGRGDVCNYWAHKHDTEQEIGYWLTSVNEYI